MRIRYDQEIEVTENQFKQLSIELRGFIVFRSEEGKFYIKVWVMKCARKVKQIMGNK